MREDDQTPFPDWIATLLGVFLPMAIVVVLLLVILIACCGCTSTHYRHGDVSVDRYSIWQGVRMDVTIWPSGTVRVEQYENDGGGEQSSKAIGSIGTAAGNVLKTVGGL